MIVHQVLCFGKGEIWQRFVRKIYRSTKTQMLNAESQKDNCGPAMEMQATEDCIELIRAL